MRAIARDRREPRTRTSGPVVTVKVAVVRRGAVMRQRRTGADREWPHGFSAGLGCVFAVLFSPSVLALVLFP